MKFKVGDFVTRTMEGETLVRRVLSIQDGDAYPEPAYLLETIFPEVGELRDVLVLRVGFIDEKYTLCEDYYRYTQRDRSPLSPVMRRIDL